MTTRKASTSIWDGNWKEWTDKKYLYRLIPTVLLFIGALQAFATFCVVIEQRQGVVLHDPVLAMFPAMNLNWIAFSLIYGGIALGVIDLLQDRERFLLGFRAYSLMLLIRMLTMTLLPLDPPVGMIILEDPLVQGFSSVEPLTRDLFFSGHTSTMFLIYLVSISPRFQRVFLLSTIAIGICVLLQKVHYTIDVLAAPFFAYGSFRLVGYLTVRRPFSWFSATARGRN